MIGILDALPAFWLSHITGITYHLTIRKKSDSYWKVSYESQLPDPENTHIGVEGEDLMDCLQRMQNLMRGEL